MAVRLHNDVNNNGMAVTGTINSITDVMGFRYESRCFNTLRPKQNGRHFPDDISWIKIYEVFTEVCSQVSN